MKKALLTALLLLSALTGIQAQRFTDKIGRGLIAMKTGSGVYLSWRILGEEYYDVSYNVYRDGVKITDTPLTVSNYSDLYGTIASKYTIAPVVRGEEQAQCAASSVWTTSYMEVKLTHEGIKSTLTPNDACCADVDGDGELEVLMKYDNTSEISQSFPKNGAKIDGIDTKEYSIFEVFKLDGTRLWWVNCGPNMGDFQNNEQNIVGYDWDQDGKAEVLMRLAEGSTIHYANGQTYTFGTDGKNGTTYANYRAATGGGSNWFMHDGKEFLVYCNGETGEVYHSFEYPLARLESGEGDLNSQWGDGYGHRSTKHFFGAPYLDGKNPSIFLARGIYTRHKMAAYDVNPLTHKLTLRWKWYNNSNGPWKGQGYHNYSIADVDWDGRDEIVYGSMIIDDNGKGLSTTGYGHGDAHHVGNFNPYAHGQEVFACNEDEQGFNYRDATTSKAYIATLKVGKDVGRCMMDNFTDSYIGSIGTAYGDPINSVTNAPVSGMGATGINSNFRIYWDGDLCSETFNYVNGKNTEGCVAKYGSWSPIYTCAGSLTNNDTKGTPCYQGDILGDWREEIIMRTANNNIRIYSTPTPTKYRNYTLWHDHQYRNAMVWQMCGYNQPPHVSYFLGQVEGITMAPPPLTMTDREEVEDGGTVNAALNGKHVIVRETKNSAVTIEEGAAPYILTFNVPTWVQGSAPSECTTKNTNITYTTYTCTVTGGGLSGDARLVKQGDGILTLPATEFKHTGATDIWAGTLNFDGKLLSSPLWLNRFAELSSNGGQFRSIKADYASEIRPGGKDSMGSITVDSLSLGFGSRIVFDLYSNGLAADKVNIGKYLKIETKTGEIWKISGPNYLAPVIQFVAHLGEGETEMPQGKYILGDISGEIKGELSDIIMEGIAKSKKLLYVEDGKLVLEILGMRDGTNVAWTGVQNGTWDWASTENFELADGSHSSTFFVANDSVLFDDNASTRNVTIDEKIYPAKVTVNNTSSYTFSGNGGIAGDAKFYKEGTGTVTIKTENSYTGGNHLNGGTTVVTLLANQYSEVGNLGAMTKTADKFTMSNGAVLQTSGNIEMGSPMKMVGEEGGVISNSGDFKMSAGFSGTLLTKKGAGCLYLNAQNTVKSIALAAGSAALAAGSQPSSIEIQNATLYDDAQNTSHAIVVPKGKTGYWHLSYTYYTAYNNKITGEGTLVINPRNTVSRVRITGDWSQFEGTIKHTNTNICLPLDASTGIPKGTLDLASGTEVSNVCKSFTIGKLTGKGSLIQPIADFKSQAAVSGSNTWKVGNSWEKNGDFRFEGAIKDAGGNNKSNFEKVGTCKMTVAGVWSNTGTVKVVGGELQIAAGASLGKGALTVSKGAMLSGLSGSTADAAGKNPFTNSSVTVNGTLRVGTLINATSGLMNFGGKNLTFNDGSVYRTGVRTNAGEAKASGTSFQNVGTLTMNGEIQVYVPATFVPKEGDTFLLWTDVKTFAGTPTVSSSVDAYVSVSEVIEGAYNIVWDTSRIAEGIISVKSVDNSVFTSIKEVESISDDEIVRVDVYSLNGAIIGSYTCPRGAARSSLKNMAIPAGTVILRMKAENGVVEIEKVIVK